MSDAPEKIWAYMHRDEETGDLELIEHLGEYPWSDLKDDPDQVEYTRADIAAARFKELEAEIERIAKFVDNFLMTKTSVEVEKNVNVGEAIRAALKTPDTEGSK